MHTRLAIIGAGPVGLAAAAHAAERGIETIVLEQGEMVGDNVRRWGHVKLFSAWEHNIDRAAERLLGTIGWNSPEAKQYPTGTELCEQYLEPLARHPSLAGAVKLGHRVTAMSRLGIDKTRTEGGPRCPSSSRRLPDRGR